MTSSERSALPIRILVPDCTGTCVVVVAQPKPLTKLHEFNEEFEIIKEIGRGGSGAVRLVKIPKKYLNNKTNEEETTKNEDNFIPAIEKTIFGMDDLDENPINDFKRELMCLTSLEHDGIVTGFGFRRNPLAIYMEYVDGGDLVSIIDKAEFSCSQAYDIIFSIASAMAYIHELGYVHRDLKPANVLVSYNSGKYCAKLCDFGGATFSFASNDVNAEAHGFVFLFFFCIKFIFYLFLLFRTSRFEAPEIILQYKEKKADFTYSQASDVYSFSMIMYCIIARSNVPLEELSSHEVSDAVLGGKRPTLPSMVNGWKTLICDCWNQQASQRPAFPQIVERISSLSANILF